MPRINVVEINEPEINDFRRYLKDKHSIETSQLEKVVCMDGVFQISSDKSFEPNHTSTILNPGNSYNVIGYGGILYYKAIDAPVLMEVWTDTAKN